jgi:hypothetical protein
LKMSDHAWWQALRTSTNLSLPKANMGALFGHDEDADDFWGALESDLLVVVEQSVEAHICECGVRRLKQERVAPPGADSSRTAADVASDNAGLARREHGRLHCSSAQLWLRPTCIFDLA